MFKIYLVEVKKKYKTAGIIYIYIYILTTILIFYWVEKLEKIKK